MKKHPSVLEAERLWSSTSSSHNFKADTSEAVDVNLKYLIGVSMSKHTQVVTTMILKETLPRGHGQSISLWIVPWTCVFSTSASKLFQLVHDPTNLQLSTNYLPNCRHILLVGSSLATSVALS